MNDFPKAVAEAWHPVAALSELRDKPLARGLLGRRLVVFQGREGPAVLLDRCPHRNAPLSKGRLRAGEVECPYHGWRFGGDGRCVLTPGLETPASHGATALPARTHAGLVWTTLNGEGQPFPVLPHPIGQPGFDDFWWPVESSRALYIDAIENLLDPAHPHFLHPGLVRSDKTRGPVRATIRIAEDRAEAVYVENQRAAAFVPRLLEGQRVTSVGRFFPPSIGQLAFEGPTGLRLAVTVWFTPEGPDRVRPFAHFSTPRRLIPAWLKKALLLATHRLILWQDQAMLRDQLDVVEAFGGPRYAMGPMDFLRPAIVMLADGQTPNPKEYEVELKL